MALRGKIVTKEDRQKIDQRLDWLRQYLFEPIQEINLEIAETPDRTIHANLENLSFHPISPGTLWGQEWHYAWFRGRYTVPETYQGQNLFLDLEPGSEGLVLVDGQEVGAIDRIHKQIPLLGREREGEHELLLHVTATRVIPQTYVVWPQLRDLDTRRYEQPRFQHARLVVQSEAAWQLYYDLSVLADLARQLPEDSLRRHRLYRALSEAVDLITWDTVDKEKRRAQFAAAREHIAPLLSLANSPSTPTIHVVGHAHIDVAWLWPLSETINKCARTFSTQLRMMELYPEYIFLQSQAQCYAFVEQHFPVLFARIREAINAGQWEVNGGMWVEADCNVAGVEALIRQFLVGGAYFREKFGRVSDTLWLPDVFGYNGNLPQILRGCDIKYFVTSKINWNETNWFPYDVFHWRGIDGSEILTHFITCRKNGYNAEIKPETLFDIWHHFQQKELLGEVIASVGEGDGGGGIHFDHLENARRLRDLEGAPRVAWTTVSETMARIAAHAPDYPTWVGELYLELHRGTYTSQAWIKRNNRKGEFLLREAELFATLAALAAASESETAADATALPPYQYPVAKIREAWQILLTHQFHDILPGSSIQRVYQEATGHYGEMARQAQEVLAEAKAFLTGTSLAPAAEEQTGADASVSDLAAEGGLTETGLPFTVWNTLNWERTDPVAIPLETTDLERQIGDYQLPAPLPSLAKAATDAASSAWQVYSPEGTPLPTQVVAGRLVFLPEGGVPGVGWRTFILKNKTNGAPATALAAPGVTATPRLLENQYLRVELDEHGQLTSVYDKEADREVLAPGQKGNVLLLAEDLPLNYDAWDINEYYRHSQQPVQGGENVTVLSAGPVEGRIRVTRSFGEGSQWIQDLVLTSTSRRLDFVTRVDWRERHKLLKVAFPVDIAATEANFEIQGGYLARPTHENTSWEHAKFEVPAQKWADLSERDYGVALLNDCKYGYSVADNVLALTLLKAATGPDPEADQGWQVFTYALLPHRGPVAESEVHREAYQLNLPYQIVPGKPSRQIPLLPEDSEAGASDGAPKPTAPVAPPCGRSLNINGGEVFLQAVKQAEEGEATIFRFGEVSGRRATITVTLPRRARRVWETNLVERELGELGRETTKVTLAIRPFEIKTLKVEWA